MGLIKNAINFGNGFNIGAVAPIDSRMRVESVSDLTSVWTAEIPAYKGMIVTVMETSEVYVLKDADNYTSLDSWVKLGSASSADAGAADALKQAKAYTDQLANGAVKKNTNAIATLNSDASTNGSVAYAVAAEKTRAMAAEKANADAIAAETKAREDAIKLLDAEVTSTDGTHVTVKVTEADGVITAVNVTESNIASTQALATETKAREDADKAINDKIGTVENGKTVVAMISAEADRATKAESALAKRVTANETSINTLKGNATTEGSVAYAVAAEQRRAEGKESELATSIANENAARTTADTALANRLTIIEGEGEGSIKKAIADIKGTLDATDAETLADLNNRIDTVVTNAKTYRISQVVGDELTSLGANVKEAYKLVENGDTGNTNVGEYIKVYKDSSLQKVELVGQELQFTYLLASGQTSTVRVDVSNFLAESEFKDGLQVVDHVVSVKRDAASEDFLTVSADGIKLSGVQTAINNAITAEIQNRTNAIKALNATAGTQAISEGTHVAVEVVETAGKLTSLVVTEDDIASADELKALKDVVGNGFTTGATVANKIADNAKAINDEKKSREDADNAINAKIGDVESGKTVVEMIADAKAAAIAASTVVAENSDFITVTKTGEVDKTQTYTITTQDIASETATTKAINDEKTRAEAAEQANADAIAAEKTRAEKAESGLSSRLTTVEGDYVKSVEAAEGSMITVAETKQKVTLSLHWGTF